MYSSLPIASAVGAGIFGVGALVMFLFSIQKLMERCIGAAWGLFAGGAVALIIAGTLGAFFSYTFPLYPFVVFVTINLVALIAFSCVGENGHHGGSSCCGSSCCGCGGNGGRRHHRRHHHHSSRSDESSSESEHNTPRRRNGRPSVQYTPEQSSDYGSDSDDGSSDS